MGERIVIASDHAAIDMKAMLVAHLQAEGHEVVDLGPGGIDSVDYPDYGYKIAEAVAGGRADRGIALRLGRRHLDLGQPPPGLPLRFGIGAADRPPGPRA